MIVIGLKGLIGSGKTTVARHLIENHGFVRGRFAGALKDMLRAYLRYRRCDEATLERMIDGDLKELPTPWLGGKSPRHAMEGLGGHWGRDWMGSEFWIGTETDKLYMGAPKRVVFEAIVYIAGEVDQEKLILGAGHTLGSVDAVFRTKSIWLVKPMG
jgi:hypothetical protein